MKIKFNYGYKKDCLFEISVDYVLKDSFYELEYNFKNNLELFRNGTLQENEIISNELTSAIENLERHFLNLILQLRYHYRIHSYFFEQDIKDGNKDYRQELKFIYDLIIPLVNNLKQHISNPYTESEVIIEW